jgi:MoaA/NifB/PqqE/SkfB family radical SAM enzyme
MFLNPGLLQIIEYGFRKGIAMSADSGVNLNFVREGVLEGLVKYRFRSLLCSIDGATPETYRIYRVGGNFERVIKHIQEMYHYKKLYQSEYPKLSWQFVVFGHNEHEIPLAREMANSLNMSFITIYISSGSPTAAVKNVSSRWNGREINNSLYMSLLRRAV